MPPKIAVVHYSSTGNVHKLAVAIGEGAAEEGADVRVLRVAELAPPEAIAQNPKWQEHAAFVEGDAGRSGVSIATLDDLEWADGIALGSPTRFGLPTAQLKQFLDQTGGLWGKGLMARKVVTAFTSASTGHGGLESTVLAMLNTAYHWGSIIMPLGYTDPAVFATGNPYGASWVPKKGSSPDDAALATARHQGRRLARVTAALAGAPI